MYNQSNNNNQNLQQPIVSENQSFIKQEKSSLPVRILKKIDIFAFIPVPKDQSVSTKNSLIGTALLTLIFFGYVIYDFITFILYNPAISQVYYTKLIGQRYQLPKFAISFMSGQYLDQTSEYNQFFNFTLTQQVKNPGEKYFKKVDLLVDKFMNDSQEQKLEHLKWLDFDTQNFYSVIRSPSQPMYARGLLYSTNNASYSKITINMCNVNDPSQGCEALQDIQKLLAGGRIFLFIQDQPDLTSISQTNKQDQNKFLIFNFFLIPQIYKRININIRVQKFTIQPDYFWRWREETFMRLKVDDIFQQASNVQANYNDNQTALELMGINFQLSPQITNTRISFQTLIDRISLWGAFWGVLFTIFALIFLQYNQRKFYKKNPDWKNFKKFYQNQKRNSTVV